MRKGLLYSNNTDFELNENIKKGLDWLKKNDLNNLPDGKYLISGENIYANIQTYITKSEAPFEAHRKYIDIQYVIDGEEQVGVVDCSDCTTIEPYNAEKDIEFLSCNVSYSFQHLSNGEFLILYPQDAHQPSMAVENPKLVKKAVVKVLV